MEATMTVAVAPGGPCRMSHKACRQGTTLEHSATAPLSVERSIPIFYSPLCPYPSHAMQVAAQKSPQDSFSNKVIEQSRGGF
jgi:hypothetical protein